MQGLVHASVPHARVDGFIWGGQHSCARQLSLPHPILKCAVTTARIYVSILTSQMDGNSNTLVCAGRRTGGAVVAGGILEPTVGRGWVNQWSLTDLTATKVASLPAEVGI